MAAGSNTLKLLHVRPFGPSIGQAATSLLNETAALRILRVVVRAGAQQHNHKTVGEIVVHCLEGRVEFAVDDQKIELVAGTMICVEAGKSQYAARLEDASLLLIAVKNEATQARAVASSTAAAEPRPVDPVDEASEESFPASDPPAFTPNGRD